MLPRILLAASLLCIGPASTLLAAEPILIDGSSTVYPIAIAAAELQNGISGSLFEISVSGTTAGMRLFATGKIPIAGASRPIRPDEAAVCATHGIEYIELPIALDGVTVAVNARNAFIDHLTVAELKRLWEPGSKVRTWAELRKGWPDAPVALFGPGGNSGTFDFFTEVIVGKSRSIREDFTGSEDDNELVQGIVSNVNALGYFGWSYFQQNSTLLRAVPVDGGHGPLAPSREAIIAGTYAPLSRPLFFYIAVTALQRPEIAEFIGTVLDHPQAVEDAGYVALSPELRAAIHRHLEKRITGSLFMGREGHPKLGDVYITGSEVPLAAPASAPATAAAVVPVKAVAAPVKAVPAPVAAPAVPAAPVQAAVPAAAPAPVAPAPAPAAAPVAAPAAVPAPSMAVAPVTTPAALAAPSIPPVELERMRAAALALARATLDRTPDRGVLRQRQQELQDALVPVLHGDGK